MHATVCLLRAGQPNSAGVAAKSVQFIGQFSWVTGEPIGRKGLMMVWVMDAVARGVQRNGFRSAGKASIWGTWYNEKSNELSLMEWSAKKMFQASRMGRQVWVCTISLIFNRMFYRMFLRENQVRNLNNIKMKPAMGTLLWLVVLTFEPRLRRAYLLVIIISRSYIHC